MDQQRGSSIGGREFVTEFTHRGLCRRAVHAQDGAAHLFVEVFSHARSQLRRTPNAEAS